MYLTCEEADLLLTLECISLYFHNTIYLKQAYGLTCSYTCHMLVSTANTMIHKKITEINIFLPHLYYFLPFPLAMLSSPLFLSLARALVGGLFLCQSSGACRDHFSFRDRRCCGAGGLGGGAVVGGPAGVAGNRFGWSVRCSWALCAAPVCLAFCCLTEPTSASRS